MDIKYIFRRMRILRMVYYKIQQKRECAKIPSDIFESSTGKIQSLKNKYTGKRCFIVGNGPSLKVEDLDKIKDEYTFAANRIFTFYYKTEWRPTFYCVQDDVVLDSIKDDLKYAVDQSQNSFVSTKYYYMCSDDVKKSDKVLWMPMRYIPPKKNRYSFSDDISKEVIEGLTITYSAMQLAAYMGFSEIYLIGIDHNYVIEIDNDGNIIKEDRNIKEYFEEAEVKVEDKNLPKIVEMTRAYISAEKYSRKNGFRIYNATRGGKLEAYERVNLDQLV